MFFTIPTLASAADTCILATVHFLYPNLANFSTWSTTSNLPTQVPKCFVGLIQMHVFPLLTATGANKTTPLHQLGSYTYELGLSAREMSSAETPNCMGGEGYTFKPPFEIPPVLCIYLGQSVAEKKSTFFTHFHGLITETNYKYFECFVMLGTHSIF